jgi:hypothetical protein
MWCPWVRNFGTSEDYNNVAGDMLLRKKHKASREVRAQLEQLLTAWRHLLQESNNHGRGLEEAQDILEFNNQAEKVEAWIRDKVCTYFLDTVKCKV